MITTSILKELKITPADLKTKFTAKKRSDDLNEFIQLTRDRVLEGRRQNLVDFRMWWAMDTAYDVPFKQVTQSMVSTFLERVVRNDMSQQDFLRAAKDWGLTQWIKDIQVDGKTTKQINLPVFFQIFVPIVRAYLHIRWAKLYNDRDIYPLLKYDPLKNTTKDRARCEIITDLIEMMGQQLGYRATLKQWIFNALHYGTSLKFPVEDYFREDGLRFDENSKVESFTKKQGLRYNIPHPSRVFYDQTHRIGTINTDSGITYGGYWRIVRYNDVMRNEAYWETDKVSMMDHDLIRTHSAFFSTVYPCQMEFPTWSRRNSSGAGELDRESNASFYTAAHKDKAVVLTEIFQKLIPKHYGLGDVEVPMWFRTVLANDNDIIYTAPLCYCPITYIGYDAHEERRRNASLTLEIAPFQDHMGNLLTQQILTAKQNLMRVVFVDEKQIPKKYVDQIVGYGEDLYRSVLFIPYNSRAAVMAQQDVRQAFTNVQFPQASTMELMNSFRLLLDTLERVLVFSAQEVGAVASHEQTAEETRLIAGNVNNRLALTDSGVEEGIYGWKKQLYDAMMGYGDAEIFAQVPAVPPITSSIIGEIGFSIIEAGIPGRTNIQVKGEKKNLQLEGFASSREGENRVNNPEVAAGMSQIMQIMMGNEMTAMAIGPEQAIKVFNTIARLAGLPRDFALHVANQEVIDKMMGKNGEEPQQQAAQMQEMFKQLGVEILDQASEQSKKMIEEIVGPITEAVEQNTAEINNLGQSVEQIMSRLEGLVGAAFRGEPNPARTQQ
jgi:hypothetical protein